MVYICFFAAFLTDNLSKREFLLEKMKFVG